LPNVNTYIEEGWKKDKASGIVLGMKHLVKYKWRRNRKA
jgi:hypothetical protein